MQIRIPEKTTEPAEKSTELLNAKQHLEAPIIIESRLSTIKSEEFTEIASPVETRRSEDWLNFIEEQSMLRAELAMAPEYDPNDEDEKYSAPEVFLEIARQQSDPERAVARRAKKIECSLLI